jgi:plasmid replication initiation protein
MSSSQDTQIVKKDNRLIEAQYRLSLHQQRVVHSLLGMIHATDEDFMHYRINIAEIAERCGLEKSNALYTQMQEAISDLVTKKLVITEGQDTIVMAWLSYARYRKGQGTVEISFHKDLKPYLLQLKSRFTQYNVSAIIRFKSSYSIRFYELLKMQEYLGRGGQFYRELTLDSLRGFLQIDEKKYKNFKDLRVFVIEPALKEISDYSDIFIVQIDYIKTGRAITDIRITAEAKREIQVQSSEGKAHETPDVAMQSLQVFGVTEETAKKWIKKYGKARVARNVAYALAMQKDGKVDSPLLYLSKAIQDDYAAQWENQNQKKLEAIAKKQQEAAREQEQHDQQLDQERREFERAADFFEGLDEAEREQILDQVASRLKTLELARFQIARQARSAHKERSYAFHFKKVMSDQGFGLSE